jgi:predicted nucleic acid-binding protein
VIVLDTSFLVSLVNAGDVNHAKARSAMKRIVAAEWGDALLPEYVFSELMTVLRARTSLEDAARVGRNILESDEFTLVPCIAHIPAAFAEFSGRKNASLSFTDAAVVAIARTLGADYVATFDKAFRRVEGIRVVP